MPTYESKVHQTPAGGVRSTIYYRDQDGNPADKAVAVQTEILEFDKDGNVIRRTYGYLKGWTPADG